ncbi:MAG: hypothetical protein PHQ23_04250 [Candidatus Wallbacteria bacterium]|nr:hypothetical protein [Candidatus Wallbacteria bacterium]
MPSMEISMPKVTDLVRARLAFDLTAVFCTTGGFEPEIFGMRFNEYGPGFAAQGGKLWDGTGHPYLHILLYTPRLKKSVKRTLIERLSAAFAAAVENPEWVPVIHLCEHPYDDIGVGGKLLSDAYEECRKRKFYYDLPED